MHNSLFRRIRVFSFLISFIVILWVLFQLLLFSLPYIRCVQFVSCCASVWMFLHLFIFPVKSFLINSVRSFVCLQLFQYTFCCCWSCCCSKNKGERVRIRRESFTQLIAFLLNALTVRLIFFFLLTFLIIIINLNLFLSHTLSKMKKKKKWCFDTHDQYTNTHTHIFKLTHSFSQHFSVKLNRNQFQNIDFIFKMLTPSALAW